MRHLNYNHLLYFWTVAREGSVARAAAALHLTPQTVSGQIKLLEESVGAPLFEQAGRRRALTDTGRMVLHYAEEIFALGSELARRVHSEGPAAPFVLNAGVVNSLAKLVAYRVLEPALHAAEPVRLVCREGELEQLLADLAVLRLDLVISDRPVPSGLNVKAYNHSLGESGVAFFAAREQAKACAADFPGCLNRVPLLLPVHTSALRRRLDDWFARHALTPQVVAEFDDSALMKAFGQAGGGVFPAPSAMNEHIERMYGARRIGDADGVVEHYYVISPERRLSHPAVRRISHAARETLFVEHDVG